MMNNYSIERIIYRMINSYAPDAPTYYKEHTASMMYNLVKFAGLQEYTDVEDMVRGMCHIFDWGIEAGMNIYSKREEK